MQGRITKVLNMKPPEILSMIEEAAGTRLYETKREAAQKTIEKKDAKLIEIETVVKEDINPTLLRLREERSSYVEYQQVIRELEYLSKLHVAYRFVCAEEGKKRSGEDLVKLQEVIKTIQERSEENKGMVAELDVKIKACEKVVEEESGEVMEKLDDTVKACKKVNLLAETKADQCRKEISAEE